MITLLSRIFIKERTEYKSPAVRRAYGILCGIAGIVLNIFLFIGKFIAGQLTGSVAITADAFNNLSDAGSSVITLIGFRLSGQKPDPQHPFGHGRMEYISGLLVSVAILIMGFELGKSSVEKLADPETPEFNTVSVCIMAVAVLVKLYMLFYNRKIASKIDSAAMRATAKDCLSDALSTLVVLAATLAGSLLGWQIDGWCGILVAAFILYSGFTSLKDTINPLLGEPPEKEFVSTVESIVMSHPEICGIHDLIVHNYGPGRCIISLHAEIPADSDIVAVHDTIDNIEAELLEHTGALAVIHMDPIVTNNETVNRMKVLVSDIVNRLDTCFSIHDFRMVEGNTHTNIIFDLVVPFGYSRSDDDIKKQLFEQIQTINPTYFTVIHVDKDFTAAK